MKKSLVKQSLTRSHTISFKEKGSDKVKSFDCPKEHIAWHLRNMKALCENIKVESKKG